MSKGLFITLEGGEGSSKTTQTNLLYKWMKNRRLPVIRTKEPGSPFIDECAMIRNLLLDPDNDIVPLSELFLFLADRAQHVEKLIRPMLKEGTHVICDRYIDSTKIYQCARGLSRDKIDILIDFATGSLAPDLTFILDIPVDVGLERAKAKSKGAGDRIEQADVKFHEDVRYGFLKLAESIQEEHRFQIISVAPPKSIEEVHEEITKHMSKKLWINGEKDG